MTPEPNGEEEKISISLDYGGTKHNARAKLVPMQKYHRQ